MQSEYAGRGGLVPLAWAATALGVLLIAIAQLWHAADARPHGGFAPPGPIGSLESVQLTDGLVLYGTLAHVGQKTVRLQRVYEVDVITQAAQQAGQPPLRTSRLVRRHAADWHGPGDMAIPIGEILFMESVPADSQAAKLIRAEEGSAPAGS